MQRITLAVALAAGLGLTACGDTVGEQALFGGAAGVGVAAVTDGDVLTGAALGAAGNVAYCQTTNNC
ncbi:MAG: hypothetical protein QNJ13_13485 [Paracoccaceae bacterium]|nr:hypothetical protein [Paracoccaceae bacterium]